MNRRDFLALTAGAALAGQTNCSQTPAPIPIIDTHVHLFDPTRPQGVPWPPPTNTVLYKPALPERLRAIAEPLGVVGAIKVEASPWIEDNQWVLDVAEKDSFMVGVVGFLELGKPEFGEQLDRFRKHPLFLGIRYGLLWGRNLAQEYGSPVFLANLKLLANAGMSLDTANQSLPLLDAVVRITDHVPELRVIIDHLPQFEPPADDAGRQTYLSTLRELAARKHVYVKVSEVFRRVDGHIPEDLDFYRPRLDEIWEIFGEDQLLFGSDWPNSDNWKPYPQVLNLVREYVTEKGRTASEKFFWRNAAAAYRFPSRDRLG